MYNPGRRRRIVQNNNVMYNNQVNDYLGVHAGLIPLIEHMKTHVGPPSGSIVAYTVENSPEGWLLCDGSEISRTKYAKLFAAIGTTFGPGDGETTFKLPDYRGAFLRGTGAKDNSSYTGPTLNASQNHATQTHAHVASSIVTDPGHVHNQRTVNDDFNCSSTYPNFSVPSFPNYDSTGTKTWSNINESTTGITVATTVSNSTTSVNPNETRPYNYGVWWIIKT